MNVYDFDGTVYAGDSTVDFYFFCLRKQPGILRVGGKQIKGFFLYKDSGVKRWFSIFCLSNCTKPNLFCSVVRK